MLVLCVAINCLLQMCNYLVLFIILDKKGFSDDLYTCILIQINIYLENM